MVKMTNQKATEASLAMASEVQLGEERRGEGAPFLQFQSFRLARGDASLYWVPALFSGLQMKLNPSSYPDEVGFHHEVISSHDRGIYPVCKDGV